MDHTALDEITRARIIRALSRRRSRDLVIRELCEAEGLDWNEAERVIADIELYHAFEIQAGQRFLKLLLGSLITLAGLALSGYVALEAVRGTVIQIADLKLPYPDMLQYFVLGLLMASGGILGIVRLLRE